MRTRVIPIRRFGTCFWRVAGWIPFRNRFQWNGIKAQTQIDSFHSGVRFRCAVIMLSCKDASSLTQHVVQKSFARPLR